MLPPPPIPAPHPSAAPSAWSRLLPQPPPLSAAPSRPQVDSGQPVLSPALRYVARSAAPESAPPPHCRNHNLKEVASPILATSLFSSRPPRNSPAAQEPSHDLSHQ